MTYLAETMQSPPTKWVVLQEHALTSRDLDATRRGFG